MTLREVEPQTAIRPRVELLDEWRRSDRTLAVQEVLLGSPTPFIAVNMDGARFGEFTRTLPLFQVLHFVDHLKREFFTHGSAIGGEPRGEIWEADNGSLIFPADVSANALLRQMIALMQKNSTFLMQMAVTVGIVNGYRLGSELYGPEVRQLDEISEDVTPGGSLYVTPAFTDLVTDRDLRSLLDAGKAGCLSVDLEQATGVELLPSSTFQEYPLPFSPAFRRFIAGYPQQPSQRIEVMTKRYISSKTVVLIKAHHETHPLLLDELAAYEEADRHLHELLATGVFRVKTNGVIGIFATDDPRTAVDFAKAAATELTQKGLVYSIGIAIGETAMFRLWGERGKVAEIAGRSVNDASFAAEDQGQPNTIAIEASVAESLGMTEGEVVNLEKSGHVILKARLIRRLA